jgi:ABC-type sulfate transport system permease component
MSKASESELVEGLSLLFTPIGVIVALVFLCIYVSDRFFKKKGRK